MKISDESQPLEYGNTIILEARVDSVPCVTNIEWTKDGKNLDLRGIKFSEDSTDGFNPKLIIDNIEFLEDGQYSIIVSNPLGSDSAHLQINIKGQERISLYLLINI